MPCPRCHGFLAAWWLFSHNEPVLPCQRCMNCGWIGGERILDLHHRLEEPPLPHGDVNTPVYDPHRKRLTYDTERDRWRWLVVR